MSSGERLSAAPQTVSRFLGHSLSFRWVKAGGLKGVSGISKDLGGMWLLFNLQTHGRNWPCWPEKGIRLYKWIAFWGSVFNCMSEVIRT